IPKNAFDNYTTAKQKKLFTDLISRIIWTHKLSTDTVNLEGKDIEEIQVFRIELKVKEKIHSVLDIIDKSIPYSIIYVVEFAESIYLSTSTKHPHPANFDVAVIDLTFSTDWLQKNGRVPELQLKGSLDYSYFLFCLRIAGYSNEWSTKTMTELVNHIR